MTNWDADTAEWYAAKYGEYATNRLAVDALELPQNAVIVDVGCGTGSALRHAASIAIHGSFIGVDPVPRMIEIACERSAEHPASSRIEYREGPAEALPVDSDSADFVLAFDSIDHWQDVEQGLSEILRVLRPGGQLVITKDGSVPGTTEARRALLGNLKRAGFEVATQQDVAADDVSFTLLICLHSQRNDLCDS